MPRVNASISPAEHDSSRLPVTIGAVVAGLYFGSEIFIPISLAILLSFVLAPSVRKLHSWGLGRVFPVLLVTFLAFTIIFGILGVLGSQLKDLANELPKYEGTITRKVMSLKGATNNGVMEHVEAVIAKLNHAVNRTAPPTSPASQDIAPAPRQPTPEVQNDQKPIPVEIRQPAPSSLETMGGLISPLIHPVATAGIVLIFVVFVLLQREDLRNRLIRLFGASDLQRTTAAINDGAKRLSRYFLAQSLVNALSGVVIGIAAWAIGIPNPVLWGILFGFMRFIPYIGPILGGACPVAFAAAVDNGWSMAIWMAGILVVVELAVGQILEPLLYGHNTGLSPVAVVVAATFWTALWGPIGLLLATPLTVCLVVIGRHVEQLAFLDVLLGDRPPLTAAETFYQRMLANDPTEVSDQATECLKSMSLLQYYDNVMLPGLLLAQADVNSERLTVERQTQIRDATDDVIEDLEGEDDGSPKRAQWSFLGPVRDDDAAIDSAAVDAPTITAGWKRDGAILCIGSRGPLDDCGATMLAQVLAQRGLGARAESFEMLSKANIDRLDASTTRLICLSCLDGSSAAYLRFALRRVRRRAPRARILIGAWWRQAEESLPSDIQLEEDRTLPDASSATIVDAARFCLAAASALEDDKLTPINETSNEELSQAS